MISTLDEKELWESDLVARLMRDVAVIQSECARLHPVKLATPPNPFEVPRQPTDPPPIWDTLAPSPRKERGSWAPFVFTMLVGAATMFVVLHTETRIRARHVLEDGVAYAKPHVTSVIDAASARLR